MNTAAAQIAAAILGLAGAVHLFWALGGEAGKRAAIPSFEGRPVIAPRAAMTAAIGVGLLACTALVLLLAGIWGRPPQIAEFAGMALALVFFLRGIGDFRYVGLFKRVKNSQFARYDTFFYSPLCFLLAGLIARVAHT